MNWSVIQNRWGSYRFAARRRWDRLSEQQLHGTHGQREQLAKRLQQAYLITHEEADRQICAWQVQVLIDSAGR